MSHWLVVSLPKLDQILALKRLTPFFCEQNNTSLVSQMPLCLLSHTLVSYSAIGGLITVLLEEYIEAWILSLFHQDETTKTTGEMQTQAH